MPMRVTSNACNNRARRLLIAVFRPWYVFFLARPPSGCGVDNIVGTEMCLELVRTCAFAALLSDEVFADVDLETVQVSQPSREPRAAVVL